MDTQLSTRENGHVELSVVILTQNDESQVRACIESVFTACESVTEYEIILVDLHSTDATVQQAAEYPVTVLQIQDERLATRGAGHYVGTQAANGHRILFVEGSITITELWLSRAVATLDRESVAAVDGQIGTPADYAGSREVDAVETVALYDRTALRAGGGFDPFLRSMAAVLLGFRLRAAGYHLLRLPTVAGTDSETSSRASLPWRRWRDTAVGAGQVLRRSLTDRGVRWLALNRFRYRIGAFAWFLVGVVTLLVGQSAVLGWLVPSLVGTGVLVSRYGPLAGLRYVIRAAVCAFGLVAGFCLSTKPADAFPLGTVVVRREGPQHIRSIPCQKMG